MNIAIDVQSFLYVKTGIGYFISQVLKNLFNDYKENRYYLYGAKDLGKDLIDQYNEKGTEVFDDIKPVPFPFRKLSRYYMEITSLIAMKKAGIQIFWGPNYRGVFNKQFKTVITIHDMAHIHYPEFVSKSSYAFLSQKLRDHAERSSMIHTVSESAREDILKYLSVPEEKVRVIYSGVDSQFKPVRDSLIREKVRNKYKLPEEYILFVGTIQPRKNLEGLIEAFHILNAGSIIPYKLVIAGCKGWRYSDIFRRIETYGLSSNVSCIGYVDYEDLPALYSMAALFVLPSYYEGFGFPVLESMACGTPVITSNVSSMPEVAGDAAILVNPHSPEMIAENIMKALSDSTLSETLRSKGLVRAKEFTWERCAAEIMSAFESIEMQS